MLSRTRPSGFRVCPDNPRPHDNLVEKTVKIGRRCGRHIMCPRSTPFPDRFGSGASAKKCGLALCLSRASFVADSVAFSLVQAKPLSMNTPSHSTVSLKVMIRWRCGKHIMCPRSTPFPSRVSSRHLMGKYRDAATCRGGCGASNSAPPAHKPPASTMSWSARRLR